MVASGTRTPERGGEMLNLPPEPATLIRVPTRGGLTLQIRQSLQQEGGEHEK